MDRQLHDPSSYAEAAPGSSTCWRCWNGSAPTVFPACRRPMSRSSTIQGWKRYDLRLQSKRASAGAPLPGRGADRVSRRSPGAAGGGLWLTEASPVTHCNPLTAGARPAPSVAVARRRGAHRGDRGADRCAGWPGRRLWVRGPNVMLGYRNAPDEEALTPDGWLAPVTSPHGRRGILTDPDSPEGHHPSSRP